MLLACLLCIILLVGALDYTMMLNTHGTIILLISHAKMPSGYRYMHVGVLLGVIESGLDSQSFFLLLLGNICLPLPLALDGSTLILWHLGAP